MLLHIGDPDPVLRDELIYGSFSEWIQDGVFATEQLRMLMDTALDENHLFYRIGEAGTDSVFVRSFSVLLLPLILSAEREKPFLDETQWKELFKAVLRVLKEERDLRGYVTESGRGWAHATAHTADALEDLAQSNRAGTVERQLILEAIRLRLLTADRIFVHDEDDRLAAAAETVLINEFGSEAEFESWLSRFAKQPSAREAEPFAGEWRVNAQLFLQRLSERLEKHPAQRVRSQTVREYAADLRM